MKKALVLDAGQRSALAVTRSLGKRGVDVFTVEETPTALASVSRYSQQHFICPSPRIQPEQFIEFLIGLVKQHHIDILLPMTELTTTLLLMNQNSFPDVTMPFPDMSTVESLANKYFLMQTAESFDIPVPKTWYVDNTESLPCRLEDLPYPIVLKPGKSWLYHKDQWSRAAVRFADSATEAKNILDSDWAFAAHPFMIQETVAGHGAGVFAIYDNGKPLALFAHRRLREKPPSGGVSVLSESVPVNPALALHAQKLLGNANWHGVAMVEFKVSPDGTPYLMEINTRFWGSLQLAIDAGVDFPFMLYQMACHEQPPPVADYKIGIKLRWILGDLDNLYLTIRNKHTPLKAKLKSFVHFFTPSPLATRHEVNRMDDMKPFWYEIRKYLRDIRG
jgi:predicted ATP-grasp superfamily ATP-dependent carboligase